MRAAFPRTMAKGWPYKNVPHGAPGRTRSTRRRATRGKERGRRRRAGGERTMAHSVGRPQRSPQMLPSGAPRTPVVETDMGQLRLGGRRSRRAPAASRCRPGRGGARDAPAAGADRRIERGIERGIERDQRDGLVRKERNGIEVAGVRRSIRCSRARTGSARRRERRGDPSRGRRARCATRLHGREHRGRPQR